MIRDVVLVVSTLCPPPSILLYLCINWDAITLGDNIFDDRTY